MDHNEEWNQKQKILVILAHPDDPEFFCGGSVARWISQGHEVHYCLLTRGEKGFSAETKNLKDLAKMRIKEQQKAASFLNVTSVKFLDLEDGYLFPTLEARSRVVKVIREKSPDVVVSCDPTNRFPRPNVLNHPDHLAAGEIVVSAIFPAAGNPLFFQEQIIKERLSPHNIKELWLSYSPEANMCLDVTEFWPVKIQALHFHRSQIGDPDKFDERMKSRIADGSTIDHPRYEEKFRRLRFGY